LTANLALWQDAFPRQYSLVKVLAQQGKWYFTRFPVLLQGGCPLCRQEQKHAFSEIKAQPL